MPRPSRSDLWLLVIPLMVVPLALLGRRWKEAEGPVVQVMAPPALPAPVPTPLPNIYSNYNHHNGIGAVLPSPDGKFIHTTSQDADRLRFRTWDARTGRLLRRFGQFRLVNTEAVQSPDGRRLGFLNGGPQGGILVLLNAATGQKATHILKPSPGSWGCGINNEVVALPSTQDVRLYSTRDGRFLYSLIHDSRNRGGARRKPREPQFSRDGRILLWFGDADDHYSAYAGGKAGDEVVWFDWRRRKLLKSVALRGMTLNRVAFSGDGKVILAVGYQPAVPRVRNAHGGQIQMFALDAGTGKRLYTRPMERGIVSDIAAAPNARWFAYSQQVPPYVTGRVRSRLIIHDARTGRVVHTTTSENPLGACAWSPDSRTLYVVENHIRRLALQRDGQWKELPQVVSP